LAKTSVVDGHRFDADPDPTFHFYAGPDPDTPSFPDIGKSDIFRLLFTVMPVYIVLSLSSGHSFNIEIFLEKSIV
jgi:hypothetical protein